MAGSSSLFCRSWFAVVALIATCALGAAASPAHASSDPPFPITESFANSSAPGWTLGGSASLTSGGVDSAGNGWLRLTAATGNQAGYAFYDTPFPSAKGASVEFDYATYGGTGADGLSFFLYDGTTTAAQFSIGAFGGSLGYAPCSSTNPARAGLNNGYIGVGFDEFGNYTNLQNSCGTAAPAAGAPSDNTARPNYVAVRGSEANNYPLLAGAATSQSLTATRNNARHVSISVLPNGRLNVFVRYPDGTYQQIVNNVQLPAASSTLKLGFAGSTGGSTNIHEIKNTKVVKPVDIQATVTDGGTGKNRANANTWTAVVTNAGTNDTNSGTFTATTGAQSLSNVSWTCTASAGSSCGTTSGTGLPTNQATGGLLPNGTLTFEITGTPATGTNYAQLSVDAQPTGDTGDYTPNNNAATDTSDLTPEFDAQPTFTLAANGTATATTTNARGNNVTYVNQWQRCNPDGTNCVNIPSATSTTYATTSADRGSTIRFTRTGTNAAGSTLSASAHYAPLPNTTITANPASQTTSTSASFSFTTATSGATFECKLDAGAWAACTSPRSLTNLAEGAHTFQARAVYGGLSDDTPASYSWLVDLSAPDTSLTSQPPANAASTTGAFAFAGTDGTGSGVASFQCRIDGGTWNACTSPQSFAGLSQGNHTVDVRAIDAVGNTDATPATYTWRVDTVAPDTSYATNTPANTASTNANFTMSGTDGGGSGVASHQCRVDGGSWNACTSPVSLTGLVDGSHTFETRAIDNAGNADATPASFTWRVDTTAPDTAITAQPAANASSTSAAFSFTGSDPSGSGVSSFQCRIDGSAWATCASGQSYTGLAQGNHTFDVRAIDNAGNADATPASHTWRVDTIAPDTQITAQPPASSASTTGAFSFTGTDAGGSGVASYECKLDAGAWAACTSPRSFTGLADGSHTVQVRAIDTAGNVDGTPASSTWIVDTTNPTTALDTTPPAQSASDTAGFTFTGADPGGSGVGAFECRLDGGSWTACGSPRNLTGLADGSHTFEVRSVDGAGNADGSPDAFTWVVDTAAPDTAILTGPVGDDDSADAQFTFAGTDGSGTGVAAYECRLDGGSWTACPSPRDLTNLADGSHTFDVRAVDGVGNRDATPASRTWTVDTTGPDTTLTSTPPAVSGSDTGTFAFSGSDAGGSGVSAFECQLDGGAWATCSSPESFTGLPDGSHTVQVRTIDVAGNPDATPASFTWTVDTGAPNTTITSHPAGVTTATTGTFTFAGTDGPTGSIAGYECRLDGGAWATCTAPKDFAGLADGTHTVDVRAIDDGGNPDPSPATYTWTVDTAAPSTFVVTSPPATSTSSSATFDFTGADPGGSGVGSFECRLDGGTWTTCTAPKTYTGLADGTHTVDIRAVDGAGTPDATPSSHSWTIDTTAPDTAISSHPAAATPATTATFTFAGTDSQGGLGVASYECRVGNGAWTACTSPRTLSGLTDGSYTFDVRAIDGAGNVDPTPATHTWRVDTAPPSTTILVHPNALSNTSTGTFTFTGADPSGSGVTTYECRIDGGAWAACTAPRSYPNLADGSHTFDVRGIDAAGNVDPSPVTYTWTIDTTGPAPSPPAPRAPSPTPRPTLTFTSEPGATLEIEVDGVVVGTTTAGPDGKATWTPSTDIADGTHEVVVVGIDGLGNRGPASAPVALTVAANPPAAPTIPSSPAIVSPDGSPSFTLDGAGKGNTTFECKLDDGTWAACPSSVSFPNLPDGTHTLIVRAVTEAGVPGDEREYTWTVDTKQPDAPVYTTTPPAKTPELAARFDLKAEEGTTLRCSIDGGTFVDCTNGLDLAGLTEGSHTIRAIAKDAAGNESSVASYEWLIAQNGVSTAKLTARLATKTIIHANKRMTIICRLSKGSTAATCQGTAYARINGKLVVIAKGSRKITKSGHANLGVRVKLNKQGMAALKKNPGGLKVSVKMVSRTREGRTLTTRVNTKIYPARKTAHLVLGPAADSAAAFGKGGALRGQVKRIAKNIASAKSVLCVGHTDKNGTAAQALATAKAACAELEKLGVKAKITVQSKGNTAPIATNQTAAGRAKNRRVKLLVRFP